MRKKGSFEYGDEAEELIFGLVSYHPKSTHQVTVEAQDKIFNKIRDGTVKRLLGNLQSEGKIKCFNVGRMLLWQR